jgi:hypothetical protein
MIEASVNTGHALILAAASVLWRSPKGAEEEFARNGKHQGGLAPWRKGLSGKQK